MNDLICGVICDMKVALEIKKRTFEIGGKTVPFKTMELMATSRDYAENAPDLQREAQAHYQKIREEIENMYKPDKGAEEVAVHLAFAEYVNDLRKVYEDACVRYDNIFDTIENSRRIWKDAKSDFPDGSISLERHKLNYLEAEERFKQDMESLRKEIDEKIGAVRDQLEMHAKAFYRASSDKLDSDTLTLLKSGILTDNELESLARKFRDNPTMYRLVGKFAGERKSDNMKSLFYNASHLGLDGQKELKLFNEAIMYGNRCIDPKGRNFSAIGRKYFDQSIGKVIDEMNGLFVQPTA